MDCPCPRCNGLDETSKFFGNSTEYTNKVEEEFKSIYDRLADLSKELEKAGVQGSLITEVNEIAEEVDAVDSKITELQKKRDTEIWVELGEISKLLF